MATLNEDLAHFVIEIVQADTRLDVCDIDRWIAKVITILRRHPYDLMQLACVRKSYPNIDTITVTDTQDAASGYVEDDPPIDSLPAPDKHAHQYGDSIPKEDADLHRLASAYFKDDPQGKGW